MAKILISYFSDYGEAMYDAISSVLTSNGNDVIRFNTNTPFVKIDHWGGSSYLKNEQVLKRIVDFKPDLVFNFNNSLPVNVINRLEKKCKICIIDADNPSTFWNKENLAINKENYFFLGLQSYSKLMFEDFLSFNLVEYENYLYLPPATVVNNDKSLLQDKKITFIGSNFYPIEVPVGEDFYSREALELYRKFKENYYFPKHKLIELDQSWSSPDWVYEKVGAYYVGQERLKHLQSLSDLGLVIYGIRGWDRIASYDFDLACCYDSSPQVSIKDNQWVYNTSKISINISHPQAKSSFSWRVMDIMASNACLLMEDKPDWRKLFSKYLSDETLSSIIYKDRYDMRAKAQALLANEALRTKCVQELNLAIEKAGRWEHRFQELEKLIRIPLVGLSKEQGNLTNLNIIFETEYLKANNNKKSDLYSSVSLKRRGKIFIYSLMLALSQLPGLNFVFNSKIRQRFLNSIGKYWY